jgi:hypothetical protein
MAITTTIVDDVAAYLATASPTLGTIIKWRLPASPDAIVAVLDAGGTAESGFGSSGIVDEAPVVQILVRGARDDVSGPYAVIDRAYKWLAKASARTMNNNKYRMCSPVQKPFILNRDANGQYTWAVHYRCERRIA